MKKEELLKAIEELKDQEEKLNVKINLDPDDIHPEKLDCIWYGGLIGSIVYKKFEISIHATGDVRATLFKNGKEEHYLKDYDNGGRFHSEFVTYLNDDDELYAALNNDSDNGYSLELRNNNWLEYRIFDMENQESFDFDLLTNIVDSNNVLEAFEDIEDYIEIIKNYEEEVLTKELVYAN